MSSSRRVQGCGFRWQGIAPLSLFCFGGLTSPLSLAFPTFWGGPSRHPHLQNENRRYGYNEFFSRHIQDGRIPGGDNDRRHALKSSTNDDPPPNTLLSLPSLSAPNSASLTANDAEERESIRGGDAAAATPVNGRGHDGDDSASTERKEKYLMGLFDNLSKALDKYVLSGSPTSATRARNIFQMMQAQGADAEIMDRALRAVRRAGLPAEEQRPSLGQTDDAERKRQADQRRQWEVFRQRQEDQTAKQQEKPRSALSQRTANNNNKPEDVLIRQVVNGDDGLNAMQHFVNGKSEFEQTIQSASSRNSDAVNQVSQLIAQAGSALQNGQGLLGIGGLDDVLSEIKRRIWTPLAAPPQLLRELGIAPVRGLLLYGPPGNGKTLLAQQLGQLLSPLRPVTVVSGPQIMDKFVGSSEKNLRELFDNPPELYSNGDNDALSQAALHVIVLDEFDAIARRRGGSGGSSQQGDAGVARDSVVNQLLAKLDGVEPLCVPTLVIGLTNQRSLIDPALLRAGRLEVHIQVPPPRTVEQRVSILAVHTRTMHQAGRLLVREPNSEEDASLFTYDELLELLAEECDGFSGAALAGVVRAAASHALERAVDDFVAYQLNTSSSSSTVSLLEDCVVTRKDFEVAVEDVRNSTGSDGTAEESDNTVAPVDTP